MADHRFEKRALAAAVFLGVGIGGFIDGIVVHQILQWHHMLSSVMPPTTMEPMEVNMRWNGYFHAFTLLMVLIGTFLLWSAGRHASPLPHTRWFVGWLIFGWGLFNFTEGIINHHLLQIHTVRYHNDVYGAEPNMAWALGFILVGGLGLMAAGWLMAHFSAHDERSR